MNDDVRDAIVAQAARLARLVSAGNHAVCPHCWLESADLVRLVRLSGLLDDQLITEETSG